MGKEEWEGLWKEVEVEDQLDSNGWPKVKGFYVDRSYYPCSDDIGFRYDSIVEFLIEQEKNVAPEKGYEEPRMVFLLQDKDYWPGTETDPEAQKRREIKQSLSPLVFPGHKDVFIHWHRHGCDIKEMLRMYDDLSLPGGSFISKHSKCTLPCCVEREDDPDMIGLCGRSSRKRNAEEEEEKEEEAREEEEKHQSNRNAEGEEEKSSHEQEKKKRKRRRKKFEKKKRSIHEQEEKKKKKN